MVVSKLALKNTFNNFVSDCQTCNCMRHTACDKGYISHHNFITKRHANKFCCLRCILHTDCCVGILITEPVVGDIFINNHVYV